MKVIAFLNNKGGEEKRQIYDSCITYFFRGI